MEKRLQKRPSGVHPSPVPPAKVRWCSPLRMEVSISPFLLTLHCVNLFPWLSLQGCACERTQHSTCYSKAQEMGVHRCVCFAVSTKTMDVWVRKDNKQTWEQMKINRISAAMAPRHPRYLGRDSDPAHIVSQRCFPLSLLPQSNCNDQTRHRLVLSS